MTVDGLTVIFACVSRLGLVFKFGFKFLVGGSVPVLFMSLIGRQFQSISIVFVCAVSTKLAGSVLKFRILVSI